MRCKHGHPLDSSGTACQTCVMEKCTERILDKLDDLLKVQYDLLKLQFNSESKNGFWQRLWIKLR